MAEAVIHALCIVLVQRKSGAQKLGRKAIFPFHADSKRFGVFFCFCFLGRELAVALSTFHIDLLSRHPRFCDNTRKTASWRGKKEEQKTSKKLIDLLWFIPRHTLPQRLGIKEFRDWTQWSFSSVWPWETWGKGPLHQCACTELGGFTRPQPQKPISCRGTSTQREH